MSVSILPAPSHVLGSKGLTDVTAARRLQMKNPGVQPSRRQTLCHVSPIVSGPWRFTRTCGYGSVGSFHTTILNDIVRAEWSIAAIWT
jgi:hypothetical protein